MLYTGGTDTRIRELTNTKDLILFRRQRSIQGIHVHFLYPTTFDQSEAFDIH